MRIAIVGAADRQLDEMLRAGGAEISNRPVGDLQALTGGSAAPDALVLDLRARPEVPASLAAFTRQHPDVGVVIVAPQLDPTLMLEAMRAGVTEWVPEPVTATTITAAVQRVIARRVSRPANGRVIACLGAKGGVGTTTLAVNVATTLGRMAPGKCLLADLHLAHGDAALLLGIEPKFSVLDALENHHRLDEAFLRGLVARSKAGVDLLASAERPAGAAPDPQQVRALIDFAAQYYQFVVLDVPRADLTMLDSLDLAARILVLANQELATVRSAGRLAATLRQRYGSDRVDVVMCRFDKTAEIGREDVERVTGGAVRHIIPSDYRLAVGASNKGQPVVIENHSRLAAAFTSLARGLAGVEAEGAPAPAQTGLLGRLGVLPARGRTAHTRSTR